jgi:hypothetical protein
MTVAQSRGYCCCGCSAPARPRALVAMFPTFRICASASSRGALRTARGSAAAVQGATLSLTTEEAPPRRGSRFRNRRLQCLPFASHVGPDRDPVRDRRCIHRAGSGEIRDPARLFEPADEQTVVLQTPQYRARVVLNRRRRFTLKRVSGLLKNRATFSVPVDPVLGNPMDARVELARIPESLNQRTLAQLAPIFRVRSEGRISEDR